MEPETPVQVEAADSAVKAPAEKVAAQRSSKSAALEELSADSARLLADAALAMFALYGVMVAFDILPPRPIDPLWWLAASTALVNAVSLPLAGVVFLHLAASIAPYTNWIHQRRQLISRLATWAALGFLLLLPLLGLTTWRGISNVSNARQMDVAALTRKANTLLVAINNASSPQELQRSMVKLQGPQIRNEDLTKPLPVLKKAETQAVNQALAAYLEQLPKPDSKAYQPLYIQTLRTGLLSLLSAIAFAAVVWDPLKRQSLLQSLLRNNIASQRSGFFRSIQKTLHQQLLNLQRPARPKRVAKNEMSQAERLSALFKSRKKDADKEKSRRSREIKRNLELQKKLSLERERKRLRAERLSSKPPER